MVDEPEPDNSGGDDDPLERHEYERETEHAERIAHIKPSALVARASQEVSDPPPLAVGAKRSDWNTQAMPEQRTRIELGFELSPPAIDRLARGSTPRAMEDKWFVFFEPPWLYFHRSWTGHCIYIVRIERTETGGRATEAFVNRDPQQYQNTNDEWDLSFLQQILKNGP